MCRAAFAAVVMFMLASAALGVAPKGKFHDRDRHFSVDLGKDWKPLSDAQSAPFRQLLAEANRGGNGQTVTTMVGAYAKRPDKPSFPVLVIAYTATDVWRGTWEQIEADLTPRRMQKSVDDKGAAGVGRVTRVSVDRARARFDATLELAEPEGPVVESMVGFFGRDGVTLFMVITSAAQANTDRVALERVVSTFKLDPGAEYVPPKRGAGGGPYATTRMMASVAFYCFMGALVVWGVKKILRR